MTPETRAELRLLAGVTGLLLAFLGGYLIRDSQVRGPERAYAAIERTFHEQQQACQEAKAQALRNYDTCEIFARAAERRGVRRSHGGGR